MNLAHICANQGSFTRGSTRVSKMRVKADRQFPAADRRPSAVFNLGWVHSLAAMETTVCCRVCACVHVCVLANIRSHGRTGTPLRAAGHFLCKVLTGSLIFTHTHTQSLQHHPMHFNSYSVERLQRFEQEHNLLQPHNTVLKSVPGHTVANSTGLIIF